MLQNLFYTVLSQVAGERSITMVLIICVVVVVAVVGVAIGSFLDKKNNPNGADPSPRVDWERRILEGPVVAHEHTTQTKIDESEHTHQKKEDFGSSSEASESGSRSIASSDDQSLSE